MDPDLKAAAQTGNIENLYQLIAGNNNIFEEIDKKILAETPLHTAASQGQIEFAMEIIEFKPSFTRKLDEQGLSPLHVAVKNEQYLMVLFLLDVDEGLARVKGKGGWTPLHYAAENGDCDVLAEFFEACPESIKDVTNQGDTALHIALVNKNTEACKALIRWLEKSVFKDALRWEFELLNWKNKAGKTVLDIAASTGQRKEVELLIKSGVYLDKKERLGWMCKMLPGCQSLLIDRVIKHRQQHPPAPTITTNATGRGKYLKLNLWFLPKFLTYVQRVHNNVSYERILVVHALVATILYQAVLSPPGGLWQGSPDINSPIQTFVHLNNTTTTTTNTHSSKFHHAGTTIMKVSAFSLFWTVNTVMFCFAIAPILSIQGSFLLLLSYLLAMSVISPTEAWSNFNLTLFFGLATFSVVFVILIWRKVIRIQWIKRRLRKRSRQPMHRRQEWW